MLFRSKIGSKNIVIVPDKHIVDLTEVCILNETSAWIWERVHDMDFTIEYIVDIVQEHYEVSREKAMTDIQAFVHLLRAKELVEED